MISDFLLKLRYVWMVMLVACSTNLCISAYWMPAMVGHIWLFVGVCLLFAVILMLMPQKLQILPVVLGTVILVLLAVLYCPRTQLLFALLHSGLYSALLVIMLPIRNWHYTQEVPNGMLFCGLAVLVVCHIATYFYEQLSTLVILTRAFMFVFAFLMVASMNRRSWLVATGGRRNYSAVMRWKNRALSLFSCVVAMAAADVLASKTKLDALIEQIKNIQIKIPTDSATSMDTTIELGASADSVAPNKASLMPFVIALVVVAAVIGCILVVVVIVSHLRHKEEKKTEDFLDEVSDTRQKNEAWETEKRDPAEKKIRKPRLFGRMSPVQQIRYRYRQLSQKHPEWRAHNTARENLPDPAAVLYEEARYSAHPISAADAAEFKKKTAKKEMETRKKDR